MKALEISELHKIYANKVTALKGISFDVDEGDFFALLGPNGAGKSTAIGIITSLVNKTGGTVEIFGMDLDREGDKAKTCVGLVPQEFNFNVFEKVIDVVANQAGYYGIPRKTALGHAEYFLTRLDLWHKRNSQSRSLSGGMKRKLMITRALIHHPRLLILDEPTAGVDVETRREMWDFMTELNRNGTTIILTTHYLEEAEKLCRNVAIINHGDIVENTSVRKLLTTIEKETFILFINPCEGEIRPLAGYEMERLDRSSLRAVLTKEHSIGSLITHLDSQGVQVRSIRNKSNRLEELFLNLVGKRDNTGSQE